MKQEEIAGGGGAESVDLVGKHRLLISISTKRSTLQKWKTARSTSSSKRHPQAQCQSFSRPLST